MRSTLRPLLARPAWTAAAILCLAIASGANTAAFSLIDGLLLRPLPFEHPETLAMVALREPLSVATRPFALREYRELASAADDTGTLLARTFFPGSLSSDDGAQMVQAEIVSGNYFEVLRVQAFAGQLFDVTADRAGSALQMVLAYDLWRRRFQSDPAVVGRAVRFNGRPAIVVAIAPPGFVGATRLVAADAWLPAAAYPGLARSTDADQVPMFGVIARLRPGVTIDEARARFTSSARTILHPSTSGDAPAVAVVPAAGFGVPPAIEGSVLTLSACVYAAMALLMMVACANVAALILARSTGRTREIAVRLSLGATRRDIARQLAIESLVLSAAGGAAGSIVALWLTKVVVLRLSTPFQYVSYAIDVHADMRVFLCSAAATTLAAVVCGIAPIRHAARVDVVELLKQSAMRARSRESRRVLNSMVTAQFALSTLLLVAAEMMTRSYLDSQLSRPAFDPAGVIAATIDLDQVGADRVRGSGLVQEMARRLSALPGVESVALARDLPLRSSGTVTVTVAPAAGLRADRIAAAEMIVSSHYFETLGFAIRQGRAFHDVEREDVAVIDETMARRLSTVGSPLGERFRVAGSTNTVEVIGIVQDGVDPAAGRRREPTVYLPFPHHYSARMTILLRARSDPASTLPEIRRTVRDVEPDLSIVDLRTLDRRLDDVNAQRRLPAAALSSVGLLGLLLSAVGLYGVVAYSVRERVREIGIRLALGARPGDVRRLVFGQGFAIVAIGLGLGLGAAAAAAAVVRKALFGVGRLDPFGVLIVCGVLTVVAAAALFLPARWAARVEPAETLRTE